jgi:hypothetical protein
MNSLVIRVAALGMLAVLSTAPLAPAQDTAAPCAPFSPSPADATHKTVCPVVGNVKHTRYCYDVKEEDYAYTKWVHSPILSIFCHDHCGKCGGCPDETEPCHNCGHAHTRKVLIKEFVPEEVPTPKCKVERVAEPCGK